MLPFDVWNKNTGGGLEEVTPYLWQILFVPLIFWAITVVPFALSYYEAHDPDRKWYYQVIVGFVSSAVFTVIVLVVVGVSYIFLGNAHIPITQYTSGQPATTLETAVAVCDSCVYLDEVVTVRMSFIVYFVGLLSLIGWIGLVTSGGCGMTALPLQCMLSFVKRPKRITFDEYAREQVKFATRAEKLIAIGEKVEEKRKKNRMDPKTRRDVSPTDGQMSALLKEIIFLKQKKMLVAKQLHDIFFLVPQIPGRCHAGRERLAKDQDSLRKRRW